MLPLQLGNIFLNFFIQDHVDLHNYIGKLYAHMSITYMEYYYLKIYESIKKKILGNGTGLFIRPFNVSIVKLDNEEYLYAVRTAIIDDLTSSNKQIPGNKRKVCDINPGENFMWNNWERAGLDGLTFFVGDHKRNNLKIQKVKINAIRMPGDRPNHLTVDREYYARPKRHDARLAKISSQILLYVTDMSEVYTIDFQKDDDLIVLTWKPALTIHKKFHWQDRNLQIVNIHNKDLLTFTNWFTKDGVSFTYGVVNDIACYIKYTDNIILGRGSNDNHDENDKKLLKNNYGIMPLFSFSTPHIPVKYNGKDALLGVGHIQIHSDEVRFPYLEGSRIGNFRKNLYDDMIEKYHDKYIKHYGSSSSKCFGYIYMMYFYILLNTENEGQALMNPDTGEPICSIDWQMKLSDAYLPLDTSTRVERVDPYDEFYQFSLVFPMGLAQRDDETIIVTCGVGDFYSVALEFKLKEVLGSCIHDASNTDMRNYKYYIIQQTDNGLLFGERLISESKTNGYYKKYLKYKKKYLQLKRLN